jgi:CheY-like chemotaxis protein
MDVEPAQILLVEDDPHDVELIQLALEAYNLINRMEVVCDGEQALHYLLEETNGSPLNPLPRLVLLDLKLPKISGVRVLQEIRSHPRIRNLVVVVMTSSQEDRDLNTCYDLGVNSYIVKPLDFQQFIEIARQVGLYWMALNQPPLLPIQN